MNDRVSQQVFVVAWAFRVKAEHREDFEHAYGPGGDWIRLFRTSDKYLKTELHRDPDVPGRYITLDFWTSRDEYEKFKETAKAEYLEIDARCERLTEEERLLGEFGDELSLHVALPELGRDTEVFPAFWIRSAVPSDLSAMMRIERGVPSAAHWTDAACADLFRSETVSRTVLVANDSNENACGFVVARIVVGECELENIVVRPDEARQGIGSKLMQELIRAVKRHGVRRIFLEVRESNLPARRLYEKLGFRRDGERADYYSGPVENAILYTLTL